MNDADGTTSHVGTKYVLRIMDIRNDVIESRKPRGDLGGEKKSATKKPVKRGDSMGETSSAKPAATANEATEG